MPVSNKYGSRIETLTGAPLINILLSSKATPPADLALVQADFTTVDLYGTIVNNPGGDFLLGDVPRLVGIGVWCNLGDGLVQNDDPDSHTEGLVMRISGRSFNSANVQQQANIQVPSFQYKIQEFNTIQDIDNLLDMSVLDYSLTGQPASSVSGYYRLTASMISATLDFAMISIDPAYAGKRLIMRPMVVVEHTYELGGF